jgi:hypothetical protein
MELNSLVECDTSHNRFLVRDIKYATVFDMVGSSGYSFIFYNLKTKE